MIIIRFYRHGDSRSSQKSESDQDQELQGSFQIRRMYSCLPARDDVGTRRGRRDSRNIQALWSMGR